MNTSYIVMRKVGVRMGSKATEQSLYCTAVTRLNTNIKESCVNFSKFQSPMDPRSLGSRLFLQVFFCGGGEEIFPLKE